VEKRIWGPILAYLIKRRGFLKEIAEGDCN
jgi:CRISPR/Cas system Type II protein with McrA/HNH and RuvC-like nuclease domain